MAQVALIACARRDRGVAQSGSAPALGAGCRRFESCLPDHFLLRQETALSCGFRHMAGANCYPYVRQSRVTRLSSASEWRPGYARVGDGHHHGLGGGLRQIVPGRSLNCIEGQGPRTLHRSELQRCVLRRTTSSGSAHPPLPCSPCPTFGMHRPCSIRKSATRQSITSDNAPDATKSGNSRRSASDKSVHKELLGRMANACLARKPLTMMLAARPSANTMRRVGRVHDRCSRMAR